MAMGANGAASLKRRVAIAVVASVGLLSPAVVWAVYSMPLMIALAAGTTVVFYLVVARYGKKRLVNPVLFVCYCCFLVTVIDTVSRPFLKSRLDYRPHGIFERVWPLMPSLTRYDSNVTYEGETFGDLAAMSSPQYREPRRVVFETDPYGFKNERGASERTVDLIVLGDSFGLGVGTSQEKTWASLLSSRYGYDVYNLSVVGSPWKELMTLKAEFDRLKVGDGAVLVWALFTGNDLDERYGTEMEPSLEQNPLKRWRVSYDTFRRRSPLRRLYNRLFHSGSGDRDRVIVKEFIDGKEILFYRPHMQRMFRPLHKVVRLRNFKRLVEVFESMRGFGELKNLKVEVVLVPSKAEVYSWVLMGSAPWTAVRGPSAFSRAVENISRANGFDYLDLRPHLVARSRELFEESGELLWWRDDTHSNERGHEASAALIHERLLSVNGGDSGTGGGGGE